MGTGGDLSTEVTGGGQALLCTEAPEQGTNFRGSGHRLDRFVAGPELPKNEAGNAENKGETPRNAGIFMIAHCLLL